MSDPVTIVVAGDPVSKGRPRFAMVGGYPRTFTPAKTRNQEGYVKLLAAQEMSGREPMSGPVELVLRVLVAVPQSWSQVKRRAAGEGLIRPTGRPDLDNVMKLVTDACNGVVYADDARIVRVVAEKRYAPAGSIVATFREIALPAPAAAATSAEEVEALFAGGSAA